MKQFVFLFFLLLGIFSYGQKINRSCPYTRIEMPAYEVCYRENYKQPFWVIYKVKPYIENNAKRKNNFRKCSSINTSTGDCYYKNIYDRGHLAPAANFKDHQDHMNLSFCFLNIALQHEKLNQKAWKDLEDHVRDLASQLNETLIIQVIIEFGSKRLSCGAMIPDKFHKLIFTSKRIYHYKFDNKPDYDYKDNLVKYINGSYVSL